MVLHNVVTTGWRALGKFTLPLLTSFKKFYWGDSVPEDFTPDQLLTLPGSLSAVLPQQA